MITSSKFFRKMTVYYRDRCRNVFNVFLVLQLEAWSVPYFEILLFSIWPKWDRYPFVIEDREPYRTKIGTATCLYMGNCSNFGAIRFAVLKHKWVTVPNLVRYGSRSNTVPFWSNNIKRNFKIKGSLRFTLLTVRLKNVTVTVVLAVKNVTVH